MHETEKFNETDSNQEVTNENNAGNLSNCPINLSRTDLVNSYCSKNLNTLKNAFLPASSCMMTLCEKNLSLSCCSNTFLSDNCHVQDIKANDKGQNICKEMTIVKPVIPHKTKDLPQKSRYGLSAGNKSAYQNKYIKLPPPKRKSGPINIRFTNSSAEVVLLEQKVEIKDLESQVKFLENQIKELRLENKTLNDLDMRQGRELKKFKEGVTDIPALLKSHREEVKALEVTISSLRKELKDCHKEIKSKNDLLLKKDLQIDKLYLNAKRSEASLLDISHENKDLKASKKELEEHNKMLSSEKEALKSENEEFKKKIQEMANIILKLEEKASKDNQLNQQLMEDLATIPKKLEQAELSSRRSTSPSGICEDVHKNACESSKSETPLLRSDSGYKSKLDAKFGEEKSEKLKHIHHENSCEKLDVFGNIVINCDDSYNDLYSELAAKDSLSFDSSVYKRSTLPPLKAPYSSSTVSCADDTNIIFTDVCNSSATVCNNSAELEVTINKNSMRGVFLKPKFDVKSSEIKMESHRKSTRDSDGVISSNNSSQCVIRIPTVKSKHSLSTKTLKSSSSTLPSHISWIDNW